ncbi:putative metalloprotease CJM1_0395 family protein [uncultured Desulfobacter sp.]|uniref:putative metalloprotease CJM1_0395 family protein n=1 Tax=uncultured Desulfobacter sp. TaxID=240139 RepID=UPI002AABBE90|nr:putative metalloprotease CJM1_0395 family protein [uncultured Desulfobacter sp.]
MDISDPPRLPDEEEQNEPASQTPEDQESQKESQPSSSTTESGLSQEEKLLVAELEKADTQVRAHEMAHIAAGGEFITSGATFSYKQGPDGKNYAVGGEVNIDASPESGDPEATLKKMRQVRAAALAPAEPSSQDLKVASNAASQAAKAMAEITQRIAEEQAEKMEAAVTGYIQKQISDAYTKTANMFGQNTPTQDSRKPFYIAV